MSSVKDDIDAWYSEIVAKTLREKESALAKAKSRFQLTVSLMDSVRMDVRDARKDVKKWKKKAAVGRIHCPRLKARMSVSASALMSVSASVPMGEDSDADSSHSTSSQSTSSAEVAVVAQRRLDVVEAQCRSELVEAQRRLEVVVAQRRLEAEVVEAQRRLEASPTSSSSSLSMNSNSSGRSQEDVEAPQGGPTAEEDAQWMMELFESLK